MRVLVLVLTVALAIAGAPAPAVAADARIATAGLSFVPPNTVVTRGDGLVHHNADAFPHNLTAVDKRPDGAPLFAGATIDAGESAQVEGVEELVAGEYAFYCTIHPTMSGTLAVSDAAQGAPRVALAPVPGTFQLPVAMAQHPHSDDLYIVEKTGRIRAVREGLVVDPVPVLDVSAEVSDGLEQGLLGLAFSPDGEFMYVNLTDTAGTTRVFEYGFADGRAVVESRREVLSVEQPFSNHNGGTLTFGRDGYLYISLGDGGSGGDPGYRAQSLETRLGKLLRIDPQPSGDLPYTVPADNPFVTREGTPPVDDTALPEIWAYGLRNPWKFSFDRETGDLWIADVGQNRWEEVNFQRAISGGGENYGWNHMEGRELYGGRPEGAQEPPNHTPPIHVYSSADGVACSITGGYVYRGAEESLQGAYVYSDWCSGELRYLQQRNGEVVEEGSLGVSVPSVTGFGEDHEGALYVISFAGAVFKVVPLP